MLLVLLVFVLLVSVIVLGAVALELVLRMLDILVSVLLPVAMLSLIALLQQLRVPRTRPKVVDLIKFGRFLLKCTLGR